MPFSSSRLRILTLLLACCAGAPCLAAETVYSCPTAVRVQSARATVEGDAPGFVVSATPDARVLLSGFNVYDGPPEQQAQLKPDDDGKDRNSASWKLGRDFPQGKWLSCDYAQGLIHAAVRLDDSVSSCTGTARKQGSPRVLHVSFRCR